MLICDNCSEKDCYRLILTKEKWVCEKCYRPVTQKKYLHEKIKVGQTLTTKAQIDELERRVILPYDKPGGGYYLGRRGNNGKVQEKMPDYR